MLGTRYLYMKYLIVVTLLTLFCFEGFSQQDGQNELMKNRQQFNFWIGEWNVYKFGTDTLVGHSQIISIMDGIAVEENYQSASGKYKGTSINKYNQAQDKWEQFYVDNIGMTLHMRGNFIDSKMTLDDAGLSANRKMVNQITWESLENKTVRQTWRQSQDDGMTWKVVFDGEYRKVTHD